MAVWQCVVRKYFRERNWFHLVTGSPVVSEILEEIVGTWRTIGKLSGSSVVWRRARGKWLGHKNATTEINYFICQRTFRVYLWTYDLC